MAFFLGFLGICSHIVHLKMISGFDVFVSVSCRKKIFDLMAEICYSLETLSLILVRTFFAVRQFVDDE